MGCWVTHKEGFQAHVSLCLSVIRESSLIQVSEMSPTFTYEGVLE